MSASIMMCSMSVILHAQTISYIQPDIASPGMQQYLEIIAPHNQQNNFGADGFYLNNAEDQVKISLVNPADSQKVVFGPLIVSWDGRLISTTAFINPELKPNSASQDLLLPEFIIPFRITVNGNSGNTEKLYVVKPHPALNTAEHGVLGSGGIWGKRSYRGAIIFDDIDLHGSHVYTFSTEDCDPAKSGNQAYLPIQLFSMNRIKLSNGARLSVDAMQQHAGAGGGGGGGAFFQNIGQAIPGGNGFTGGQMRNAPGSGAGGNGSGSSGGAGLNGVAGGGGGASGTAGTGGGTGFPFGSSGQGGIPSQCNTNNMPSRLGGGSGANLCGNIGYGGAGGGFGSDGFSATSGKGLKHANAMLVPFAGGSGGAGGNPVNGQAGYGGGGGGALHLCAMQEVNLNIIQARGAAGSSTGEQVEGFYSGAGGGGSGGAIMISSKSHSRIAQVQLSGGQGGMAIAGISEEQRGGSGGAGRFRVNGNDSLNTAVFPAVASSYSGHSTDTITVAPLRSFTLNGYGNGNPIDVYLKPESGKWEQYGTVSDYSRRFSIGIEIPCTDTVFYIVTAQRISELAFENEKNPVSIFSPSGANRIFAPDPPVEVPIWANTPLCLGLNLQLAAVYESPFYHWKGPNGFESFEPYPVIEQVNGINQGIYTLDALVFGCEVEQGSLEVEVKLPPIISIGRDTVICPGMNFVIGPGDEFSSYLWQDFSDNPIYYVSDTGTYHVQIVDVYGCEAEASLKVGYLCENNFWMPNAFSPNADDKNERFGPVGNYFHDKYRLKIYNRWGELVFDKYDYNVFWDGKYKGQVAKPDVYIYELIYKNHIENKQILQRGKVILIR